MTEMRRATKLVVTLWLGITALAGSTAAADIQVYGRSARTARACILTYLSAASHLFCDSRRLVVTACIAYSG